MKRVVVVALTLALSACAPSSYPGAVKPAPPGPVDVVRSMWGDYGGRCPDRYQYCAGSSQAICCPIEERCAEDSGGTFCAPRGGPRGDADSYGRSRPDCLPDELTCSYAGRTACCGGYQVCCIVDGGPACCEGGAPP